MTNRKRKIRSVLGAWCLVLGLAACGQETLYNQLTQVDANRVMVLLQQHGIQAEIEEQVIQNEVFWRVKISKENVGRARELIVTSQVISPRVPGLEEVYQGKGSGGWIKTPAEERARYLLAMKGEIVNSLKKLPDVIEVDVVLNVPQEEDFGLKDKKRPTASVVIKAQPPGTNDSVLNEVQIQQFVANAVEGMSPRDVSVLLNFVAPVGIKLEPGQTVLLPKGPATDKMRLNTSEAEKTDRQLMGLRLDAASKDRLRVYLIIFFVVLVIVSAALIMSILQLSRTRQELKGLQSGTARPALGMGGPARERSPAIAAPPVEEEEEEEEEDAT